MTLETLAQTVHNINAEVQQMKNAVQAINADTVTTTATINQLQTHASQQVQEIQAAVAVSEGIKRAGDALTEEVRAAVYKLNQLEQQANTSSGIGHDGKKKWHLTSPKDMVPDVFTGKDETWLQWKEATEDYAEACHPGLKHAMEVAAEVSGPITDCSQLV